MDRIVASFFVDETAWRQFQALCDEAAETPDTVLRELIRKEIQRCTRRKTRRSEAPDEALLGRLRLLVAEALIESNDWDSYRRALRNRSLGLIPGGGGLVLAEHPLGRPLAKASSVGPGYAKLVRRFGAQLPGHAERARFPLPQAGQTRTNSPFAGS